MSAGLYAGLLRPALFALPADTSARLGEAALRAWPAWALADRLQRLSAPQPGLAMRFAGVEIASPVGLAAGFDKNADMLPALSRLGFGFLCVGTIMPKPRVGNPRPRLLRLPQQEGLRDSMGLPGKGCAHVVDRLRAYRRGGGRVPVFANVGGFTADELAETANRVAPHADAIELSLICPNIRRDGAPFDALGRLKAVLPRLDIDPGRVVLRVPNDVADEPDRFAALIEAAVAGGLGGLKVGGGSTTPEPRLASGAGTLHGAPIRRRALHNVALAGHVARGRIPIKGNGGIGSAADVRRMLAAGAVCVDLYTAFVYRGWTLARDIARELAADAPPG